MYIQYIFYRYIIVPSSRACSNGVQLLITEQTLSEGKVVTWTSLLNESGVTALFNNFLEQNTFDIANLLWSSFFDMKFEKCHLA